MCIRDSYETATNYPPYNLIHVNNVESVLEIALAGFGKKELKVYTEYGKLIVEGSKEIKETGIILWGFNIPFFIGIWLNRSVSAIGLTIIKSLIGGHYDFTTKI